MYIYLLIGLKPGFISDQVHINNNILENRLNSNVRKTLFVIEGADSSDTLNAKPVRFNLYLGVEIINYIG